MIISLVEVIDPNQKSCLGYFLRYETWGKATDLLEFQISQVNKNRSYNKFSYFSYRKKHETSRKTIASEEYFRDRVANNFFYGLEKEFRTIPLLVSKEGGGRRNSVYLSYPLQAIHNAIGIYLLELTNQLRSSMSNKAIFSSYGADLSRFLLSSKSIKRNQALYFKPHFERYKKQARHLLTKRGLENRMVLYFDIKDFFDNVPVSTLLNLIEDALTGSARVKMHFDEHTKEQITTFYGFIQNEGGIPPGLTHLNEV